MIDESEAIFRELEDPLGLGHVALARIFWSEGLEDAEALRERAAEAAVLLLEAGDFIGYLDASRYVARAELNLGNLEEASRSVRETLRQTAEASDASSVTTALQILSTMRIMAGDQAEAARLAGAIETIKDRYHVSPPIGLVRQLHSLYGSPDLADPAVRSAYEEGRRMSLQDAVALGLEEPTG
jgi:hypothetical protein